MGRKKKKKHPIATPPLETLSRHKVLCRDKNVPPMGKLCRDTRRPLSLPKPGLALSLVATLNFCCNLGRKNLYRNKESLYHDPNHPASLGTMSRCEGLCRDTKPKSSIARASRSRAHACCAHLGMSCAGLRTLSRPMTTVAT